MIKAEFIKSQKVILDKKTNRALNTRHRVAAR